MVDDILTYYRSDYRQFTIGTAKLVCDHSGIQEFADLSPSRILENKNNWIPFSDKAIRHELEELAKSDLPLESVELFGAAIFRSWATSHLRKGIFTDFQGIYQTSLYPQGLLDSIKRNPNFFCFTQPLTKILQPVLVTDTTESFEKLSFWAVIDISLPKILPQKPTINIYITTEFTAGSMKLAQESSFLEKIRKVLQNREFEEYTHFKILSIPTQKDSMAVAWDIYNRLVNYQPIPDMQDFVVSDSRKQMKAMLRRMYPNPLIEPMVEFEDITFFQPL
ncbi:hypothetical protein NEOLI_004321 [Neolecta irregularis DAH-3]|uniref:Uncharacterized protein n=1 Tax=Neolecta irregularis (strain DAH-3) TaxID=1198029 RepID=A0A1U7LQS3_NEOID|nr:hypothetical protein NEOLI_004321 [Neolecta irregularis DAH-3]|eukprot:OLL24978.1 hypothetical protein NEOLI_004321 [Neolecta irregularis DAH-3]